MGDLGGFEAAGEPSLADDHPSPAANLPIVEGIEFIPRHVREQLHSEHAPLVDHAARMLRDAKAAFMARVYGRTIDDGGPEAGDPQAPPLTPWLPDDAARELLIEKRIKANDEGKKVDVVYEALDTEDFIAINAVVDATFGDTVVAGADAAALSATAEAGAEGDGSVQVSSLLRALASWAMAHLLIVLSAVLRVWRRADIEVGVAREGHSPARQALQAPPRISTAFPWIREQYKMAALLLHSGRFTYNLHVLRKKSQPTIVLLNRDLCFDQRLLRLPARVAPCGGISFSASHTKSQSSRRGQRRDWLALR